MSLVSLTKVKFQQICNSCTLYFPACSFKINGISCSFGMHQVSSTAVPKEFEAFNYTTDPLSLYIIMGHKIVPQILDLALPELFWMW
jgi:hypothetical protein